ncbi:MAG: TolC family protein [Cyclobacteriaceae bacterium]
MKKWIFIVLQALIFSGQVIAQDTVALYKADLFPKLEAGNKSLIAARFEAEMAGADYNQSKALWLPSITATHTAIVTTNPLMAFGSKLNQEILTQADFNPTLLNNPDRIQNYATEILVQQPLLNLDGIQERKAARIQADAMTLKADRTMEFIEFEVVKAYMQLQLGYEALSVLEKAKLTAEEGVAFVTDYMDAGLLQKTDLLAMQVRAGEVTNQLGYAQSNLRNGSDYLALLLGEELNGAIYQPTDRLIDEANLQSFSGDLPDTRKDIQAMEMSVQGYGKMLNASKMKLLPRVNAFGSYQLYDDKPLGFQANGYLAGISLSWALFDGNKSMGQLQKARSQFEKAQVEKEEYNARQELNLNKTRRQLKDAKNKLEVSLLAKNHAIEDYRIRKDRFIEGLEKTTDFLMSETKMFQKELEYKEAIFEYNLTVELLNFLTK